MSIDKKLLKRLKLLFVEDDTVVREELQQLLSDFFGKIYIACDGQEGYDLYLENKDDIDVILTDINMPRLSGIDMVKKIRKKDTKIPVFFGTAHSDNELLAEAIKLKVHDYLIKPIDVRHLLNMMNDLANVLYQDFLLKQQNKELEQYKMVIDSNNIVVKTDIHMKITYVNELFCQITGYDKDELLGQDFKAIKHPEMSNDIYTNMYATVLNNKPWHGVLKNLTKEHGNFTTECHIITTLNDSGEVTGAISIQRDITEELNKKRNIQLALMKDKSDIFIRSKEGSAEQSLVINNLKKQLEQLKSQSNKSEQNLDKYIYTAEKYAVENRTLRTELAAYKKKASTHNQSIKLAKENADLLYKIKKVNSRFDEQSKEYEKKITQLKANHQIKLAEMQKELSELSEQLENLETDDVLIQKLEYWKEKAQTEISRIESLEKEIIAYGDKNFMKKVFG